MKNINTYILVGVLVFFPLASANAALDTYLKIDGVDNDSKTRTGTSSETGDININNTSDNTAGPAILEIEPIRGEEPESQTRGRDVEIKQTEEERVIQHNESDFTLDHVRDVIFHEEDNDDMMKVVAMFDCGGEASELSNVLELVTDAWNYFPHEILGGISPAEKLLEHHNKSKK